MASSIRKNKRGISLSGGFVCSRIFRGPYQKKGETIIFSAGDSAVATTRLKALYENEVVARTPRTSFFNCLKNSAQQFYFRPKEDDAYLLAGYPWFKVRARDLFVALPGSTLLSMIRFVLRRSCIRRCRRCGRIWRMGVSMR